MSSSFQLRVGSLDVDRVLVHAFEGREELSKGSRFDIVASIAKPDAHDVEATLLGREACLSLAVGGSARAIRGIVAAVAVLGANRRGRITTRLRLVPRLARLEHRRTSRILQDQSIPDIVRTVLEEQGVASEWRLGSSHPPHAYCVQYQETDAELVHRLLAEAGIFYWFRHDEHDEPTAVETVVFADHAGAYAPIPGDPNLVFRASAGSALEQEEHHVHRFEAKRALAPRSLRMRDYDFKRPSLDLGSAALIESEGPAASVEARSPRRTAPFEVYQHPGEVDDPVVRDETASKALDAARRRAAKRVGNDELSNVGGTLLESAGETMRSTERDYRVHAGGSLHLFAGGDASGGGGGRIDSYSTGDHMLGAGAVLRIVAHEAIELVCGSSTIRMTQDAIEIRAKKTTITAEKTATLRGGSVAIAGSTTIGGKVVKIASAGASLVLDGDAHLDGGLVKLNCGGSGEGNAGTPVPPDEARKLSLRLLDGFEPYASKKARVSAGGKHLTTTTQADGLLEVDIPKDATSCIVTLWTDEFPDGPTRTWDVKLAELAPASEVVGAQQRLRNLGYYRSSSKPGPAISRDSRHRQREVECQEAARVVGVA
jgi:hypothetical protein